MTFCLKPLIMSLRTWNTSYERRKLKSDINALQDLIEGVTLQLDDDDVSECYDDQFMSLSSSSKSLSSFPSMELSLCSESTDELDFVETSTQHTLIWANRICRQIQNDNINFGQRLWIVDFSDSECILHFRFRKVDLQAFADQLWTRISPFLGPRKENPTLQNCYHAPFESCLLLYLFRMSRPRHLHEDCESISGMQKLHLSAAILTFARGLFMLSIKYLLDPKIWHPRMPYYASLISQSINRLMRNIWGFIDGTYCQTSCPICYQHLCYAKYKKCHAIKFQSIVTPDGMIAYLFGPFVGKHHDARTLVESGLMNILQDLMSANGSNGLIYSLYGDLEYPQSIWLFSGFLNPILNLQLSNMDPAIPT